MSVLNEKLTAISHELSNGNVGASAAPGPFLEFLMQLAQQLLPLLIGCLPPAKKNAAGLAEALNNPNLRQRLALRFYLRQNIDDPRTGMLTLPQISDAIYKHAKTVSEADATELMAEVAS